MATAYNFEQYLESTLPQTQTGSPLRMIKRLSLPDLIDAAVNLDKSSQEMLIAAIANARDSAATTPAPAPHTAFAGQWASLAAEGLARAYGDDEPVYTEADIVP
jgi:hypothetical protein